MVLSVVLDNNVWTFSPGQTINGNVLVTKNIWHKVEGLQIRFLGKLEFGSAAAAPILPPRDALPNYQQDRSLFNRMTRGRGVEDVVLDHKMNLLHSWKVLKPGSHQFPFSYILPDEDNLPDSIKIDGLRVSYEFVVVLRRPRDDYKVYQTPFYVQTKLLQNEIYSSEIISKYPDDFSLKTEDSLGCCMCFRTGPYGLLFRVPRRIAFVGKDVDFIMEIWNETKVAMESAKVALVRIFRHRKGLETKKKEIVSELTGPSIASNGHQVWTTFFRIPANTPQTNFVRRETYEINYYLKAYIHPVGSANKKISVKCPILVILPNDEFISTGTNNQLICCDTNELTTPTPTIDSCGNVQNIVHGVPPPTYEEAMAQDNTSNSPLLECAP